MRFDLIQDRKGMVWDLLLYVPTVTALGGLSAYFWYADQPNYSYLLLFLSSFFFVAGTTRILNTRLMVWRTAPVAIEVANNMVSLVLRNGTRVDLLKDVKFYSEFSGRTFGLSGMDGSGRRLQYVFHRGQFPDDKNYQQAVKALRDR